MVQGKNHYFNLKLYTTGSLSFLSFHLIQVDSGQTTTNLMVLNLHTLLK